MNIIVCVSQTPDTTTKITLAADNVSIDPKGVKFILSPYDEFAVEEGLRLKEKNGGSVTLVCVGGEGAKEAMRLGLAMGADRGVLVQDDARPDSFGVAKQLADVIGAAGPDIILLGRQSIDYDSAQIGPMIAELLNLPCVSYVTSLDISDGIVRAERDIEGGKEVVETTLPCVITAQKGLNEPRYPKLPDIMKAKQKPIDQVAGSAPEPRVTTLQMRKPEKQRANKIMEASPDNIRELVRLLHQEAKVI